MLELVITSDGQLAFLFENNGVIPVVGLADFFGMPTFISLTDEPYYFLS